MTAFDSTVPGTWHFHEPIMHCTSMQPITRVGHVVFPGFSVQVSAFLTSDCVPALLPADLVARQKAAIAERKATKVGLASDTAWTGEHGCPQGGGEPPGVLPLGVQPSGAQP